MAESEEELKSLLMKVKVESEKLKLIASGPITSQQINGEKMETVIQFSWAAKSLQRMIAAL